MTALFRALLRLPLAALDVLAPRACAACDADLDGPHAFCKRCRAKLRPAPPSHIGAVPVIAGAAYGDPVAIALHRFKYRGRADLAPALADLLDPGLIGDNLLVPVPLHPIRLAERGYNQSALLARALAGRCGARWAPSALVRTRATLQQARQSAQDRRRNVAGAFSVRRPAKVAGRRVVLVDDVITTGATAADCIRALTETRVEVAAVVAVALALKGGEMT